MEIVGIAANVHQNLENSAWPETVYEPLAQGPPPSAMLAVKTSGDPLRLTKPIREQVRAIDRDQPILKAQTMDDLLDEELGQRLLILRLLGSFAGVALLLALIGIYGAVSYSVTLRVHELGIRGALGARQWQILGLVMRQGLSLTIAGIVRRHRRSAPVDAGDAKPAVPDERRRSSRLCRHWAAVYFDGDCRYLYSGAPGDADRPDDGATNLTTPLSNGRL